MIRTTLCDLVGIELPIVQAPIASSPELAAAVSGAGGLGTLQLSWRPVEEIETVVRGTRARTERPFAVNLVLEWDQRERLDAALEAGVPVVSLLWGDPAPYVDRARECGALVLVTVGTPSEALRAVEAGADAVVAQGFEAGGHVWGQTTTMVLVPTVVDAVAPVPVVAAGGIADGRGVAAALTLGAAGAWLGTRFLTAAETPIHPEYRERLFRAQATDTVYSTVFDGGWPAAPHRTLRNSTTELWEQAGRPDPGARPGEGDVLATHRDGTPILRYDSADPNDATTGDIEALSLWAGQSVGLVSRRQPAAEIVRELAAEAASALERVKSTP